MNVGCLIGVCASLFFAMGANAFPTGKSVFEFDDSNGHKINVQVYQAAKFDKTSPIQFVMHGMSRNADQSLENWVAIAEREGLLIAAPHFDAKQFRRTSDYALGPVRDGKYTIDSLMTVEKLFDVIKNNTGSERTAYRIFGHSAGAQFVHHMVLLVPDSRLELAIAANAGHYTWPEWRVGKGALALPNGLLNVDDAEGKLTMALEKNLIILLGEIDNDPKHPQLAHGKGVDRQGQERFSRGQNFFKASQTVASEMKVTSRWVLKTVPDVGHDQAAMARAAIELIYPTGAKK